MLAHWGPIVLVWFMWTIVLNHSHNDLWRRERELVGVHDDTRNSPFLHLLSIFSSLLNHKLYERHPVMFFFFFFSPKVSNRISSTIAAFLSFQMKTRLSLVLTMTHSSRLPPYPIYSAQCPRQFTLCVCLPLRLTLPRFIHPPSTSSRWPPPSFLLRSPPLLVCIISSVFLSLGS